MLNQAAILSDVIQREHALAASPARLERRRVANTVEALRCCSSSLAGRPHDVVDREAATRCATG